MAYIDITEEEAVVIADSIRVAHEERQIEDEYTAFYLLQSFKREFPNMENVFDFMDYEFSKNLDEEE
jgi:hypothetical protein